MQAAQRQVQSITTGLGGLTVADSQLISASNSDKAVKKKEVNRTFDRLALVHITTISEFACSTVKDFFAFKKVCQLFKDLSSLAFKGNSALVADFCSKRAITPEHRDILDGINQPYLDFIHAQRNTIESFTYPSHQFDSKKITKSTIAALVSAFPNLKKLNLSNCEFDGEDCLEPLSKIPLIELHLAYHAGIYKQLKSIGQITTLQKLALKGEPGTLLKSVAPADFEYFKYLQLLQNLQEIDFKNCHIRDEDLAYIPKKNLTSLSLMNCDNITDAGLEHVSQATNLRRLNLAWTQVTNTGLYTIGDLRLTQLDLRCLEISDLFALQHIHLLEELYLFSDDITDFGLSPLKRACNLTKLKLSSWSTDSSALHYFTLPQHKLRELDLYDTHFLDKKFVFIPTLTHLNLSDISGITVDDAFLAAISTLLSNLESLELGHCVRVTDKGLQSLALMKKLSFLQISIFSKDRREGTVFTEEGVKQLLSKLPRHARADISVIDG
jgi:hypothetical protein